MPFDSYLQLTLIVIIGYFSGQFRLYNNPDNAIDAFNRFSLYIGFPVLMFQSLVQKQYVLPSGISFYLAHFISIGLAIILLRLFVFSTGQKFKNVLGAMTIGTVFGNIAYLGIPICSQIFDNKDLGIVSLSAAIHLVIALSLGQFLMIKWSPNETSYKNLFSAFIKQPLIWAPILGILFRFFPEDFIYYISVPLNPIAACAGPISLYMLGLYLYANRKYMVIPKSATFITVVFKMVLLPVIFTIIGILGNRAWLLTNSEVNVMIIMASMPVAITTFSLTYQYKTGQEIIAQAIVISTFLSFLLLPLLLSSIRLLLSY